MKTFSDFNIDVPAGSLGEIKQLDFFEYITQ